MLINKEIDAVSENVYNTFDYDKSSVCPARRKGRSSYAKRFRKINEREKRRNH